jgi:hypothetical protein
MSDSFRDRLYPPEREGWVENTKASDSLTERNSQVSSVVECLTCCFNEQAMTIKERKIKQ